MNEQSAPNSELYGSFETLSSTGSVKRTKKHITVEQKEFLMNYVMENPEMVTHSSTKENEKELWRQLGAELNILKPEKSLDSWKNFWCRWRTGLFLKPESNLNAVESKFKQFLNKIMNNNESNDSKEAQKSVNGVQKLMTIEDINNHLKNIEKEKSKLNLEVDDNDFRILKYKTILSTSVREAHMGYGDSVTNNAVNTNSTPAYGNKKEELFGACPAGTLCSELSVECLTCSLKENCVYGTSYTANCTALSQVNCVGNTNFVKPYICRYCYQTEHWEHDCQQKNSCSSVASPQQYYRTNCTVNSDILCLGRRKFLKNLPCNWTGGYRWSTALILSMTLGGFGADRFYLGHWQEGIGKLFSFGGLGVWTLIDVMLISMRYLGPADGSLYI